MTRPTFGAQVVASPHVVDHWVDAPWVHDLAADHASRQADLFPHAFAPLPEVATYHWPCPGQRILWPELDTLGAAFARGAVSTLD